MEQLIRGIKTIKMSRADRDKAPLREIISVDLSDIKESLARIETHNEYTKEKILEHNKKIESLSGWMNFAKGASAFASAIGIGSVIHFFKNGGL
jgi:hypothetical protein